MPDTLMSYKDYNSRSWREKVGAISLDNLAKLAAFKPKNLNKVQEMCEAYVRENQSSWAEEQVISVGYLSRHSTMSHINIRLPLTLPDASQATSSGIGSNGTGSSGAGSSGTQPPARQPAVPDTATRASTSKRGGKQLALTPTQLRPPLIDLVSDSDTPATTTTTTTTAKPTASGGGKQQKTKPSTAATRDTTGQSTASGGEHPKDLMSSMLRCLRMSLRPRRKSGSETHTGSSPIKSTHSDDDSE